MWLGLITLIFLALYMLLISFYYFQWKKSRSFLVNEIENPPFVSIIVAARNEEENISHLLTDLSHQSYNSDRFEIIVADDFSSDRTAAIAKDLRARVISPTVDVGDSSKKKCIEAGINAASGELMIITDADCRVPPNWIKAHVSFYRENNSVFIAAPVAYSTGSSVLDIFQQLDFLTLQGITAASVSSGFHNMCNGANLAYTKEAFVEVNGFSGIDHVATGDDMLLMHKISERYPSRVHYMKCADAIVSTAPMATLRDFVAQRKRWASKTLVYKDWKIVAVLAFILLFNLLFLILLAAAFFEAEAWWLVLTYLLAKTAIEFPFVYAVAVFFKKTKLMFCFPFFQPLHIVYTVAVGLLSQIGKYKWKGRLVR